ncbi:MAG: AGE family epimerase/isomerase [Oscillospiraceae bacterium]|nr:AGE family epimerase/isomerase [Oscillospiraceae bacterium]
MERIASAAKQHLLTVILPFWKKLRDDAFGGFYGYMDQQLQLDTGAEKGCILNSRILWFFSEAAMALQDRELEDYARHAYRFLRDHCLDRKNGGIFWSMTYDGKPLDTTKHTYNQGFAIYALSSYYRLTGEEEALREAMDIFRLIEEHCTDEIGYLEAFTADWKPQSNEKLSENGVMAAKTMNTLLHVFEGYSGLYRASADPQVRRCMERILTIYETKIFDHNRNRQLVFFDENYESIIDLYSYGHDIESSWLMDWGAGLLEDPQLSRRIGELNRKMAEAVYHHAYDHNSLANECDRGEKNELRIWWVQAEAVVGFVHQWQKTGEDIYARAAADTFRFILKYVWDKRDGGEWFWCVDKQGVPTPEKPIVEPWKCPYHNGRMCLELMRREPDIYV